MWFTRVSASANNFSIIFFLLRQWLETIPRHVNTNILLLFLCKGQHIYLNRKLIFVAWFHFDVTHQPNRHFRSFLVKTDLRNTICFIPSHFPAIYWVKTEIKFGYSWFLCKSMHMCDRHSPFVYSADVSCMRWSVGLTHAILSRVTWVIKLDSYTFLHIGHILSWIKTSTQREKAIYMKIIYWNWKIKVM